MEHMHRDLLDLIANWPDRVQLAFARARTVFCDVADAAEVGPLDESLKWGQPAWRPRRARTGSTLRMTWSPETPDHLLVYVDCKTDLAEQMEARFPGQFDNDGRRAMTFEIGADLPEDALWQLAYLTFTYHRNKRASA
ncbi:hypothetical protein [uncultured Tateyamaria sp.]|uniref:hypothetical protein n=1 Tax=uncultured Tateyamaria sp. TaxID=455651 RepID=UPI00260E6D63|nr:hypothetical protein [uncultured Tateyamaria sp.]